MTQTAVKLTPTRDVDELTDALCDALLTPRNREAMRRLLRDLCTPSELTALAERWHVARLLDGTGVSTTTIVRVGRFLRQEGHRGYRGAIDALSDANAR